MSGFQRQRSSRGHDGALDSDFVELFGRKASSCELGSDQSYLIVTPAVGRPLAIGDRFLHSPRPRLISRNLCCASTKGAGESLPLWSGRIVPYGQSETSREWSPGRLPVAILRSPATCACRIKCEHIGGAARRELGGKHDGRGPDNRKRFMNAREWAIKTNENQPVDGTKGLLLGGGSSQNNDLLPQR